MKLLRIKIKPYSPVLITLRPIAFIYSVKLFERKKNIFLLVGIFTLLHSELDTMYSKPKLNSATTCDRMATLHCMNRLLCVNELKNYLSSIHTRVSHKCKRKTSLEFPLQRIRIHVQMFMLASQDNFDEISPHSMCNSHLDSRCYSKATIRINNNLQNRCIH